MPIKKATPVKKNAPAKKRKPPVQSAVLIHRGDQPNDRGFTAINSADGLILNQLNKIIETLEPLVDEERTNTAAAEKPVQTSFKENVHDIIVTHEMEATKNKITQELANSGDVYYITQAEKDKMVKAVKKFKNAAAMDALCFGISCFIIGVAIGKIIGFSEGSEATVEAVNANFNVTPKFT